MNNSELARLRNATVPGNKWRIAKTPAGLVLGASSDATVCVRGDADEDGGFGLIAALRYRP